LLWEGELGAGRRMQVQRRLLAWTRDLVDDMLGGLRRGHIRDLSPAGKGLVYQLEQGLGAVLSDAAREQLRHLTARDRERLRQMSIYIGYRVVFVRGCWKPDGIVARLALCSAFYDLRSTGLALKHNTVSVKASSAVPPAVYLAIGYPVFGSRAIRADIVERFDRRLYQLSRTGPFAVTREFGSWLGCSPKELASIIEALGYHRDETGLYHAQIVAALSAPEKVPDERSENPSSLC
jgi:ATP-dependent RNA helicase SUPV3L1/SUV3